MKSHTIRPILRFSLIAILVVSAIFHMANLDKKIYWKDEALTALRLSGHSDLELIQTVSQSGFTTADLAPFQQTNNGHTVRDTLHSLKTDDAHLPPLFFVITRKWMQAFGDTVASSRFPAAAISLLAFPLAYWLGLELFGTARAAWIGTAIIAVSPFHLLYAQEARFYTLWTVAILLSCATFLRALRKNTKTSWLIYAAAVSLALYSSLLSLLVIATHGFYVLLVNRLKIKSETLYFCLASGFGILTFIPWALHIKNLNALSHLESAYSLSTFLKLWTLNVSRGFIDLDITYTLNNPLTYLVIPVLLGVIGLIAYAFYFLIRYAPKRIALFLILLTGLTTLPFLLQDLLLGKHQTALPRYFFPAYIGMQLVVTYLLSQKMAEAAAQGQRSRPWTLALTGVLAVGLLSCLQISQATYWWSKYDGEDYAPIADILEAAAAPRLWFVNPTQRLLGEALAMSHLLGPQVTMDMFSTVNVPGDLSLSGDIYILNPPSVWFEAFQDNPAYDLTTVYTGRYHSLAHLTAR